MWIPQTIAKVMKGALNIEELRDKLAIVAPQEEEKQEIECDPSCSPQKQSINNNNSQEEGNEDGWSPVPPGKAARRHHPKETRNKPQSVEIEAGDAGIGDHEENEAPGLTCKERGGNPQIFSSQ